MRAREFTNSNTPAESSRKGRNVATKPKTSESFDRDEFLRHMAKLRAREELRKTDPVKALVQDLKDQDKQQPAKKPSDDSDLGDPNIDPLNERLKKCPHCGGPVVSEQELEEKQDACYYKVKSRYKVWPSAYASGALVQCRKRGAKNWGKSKTNEAAPWLGQGDEPLPTKLYHVTRTRNRLSIRQRGLVPKTKEHKRVFRKPGVFGFETFEQAEDWAYYWSQDDRESMDIWEIDVEDTSDLTPDSAWDIQQDYDAWVIYKPIPAANVRLKFTQRWPEPRGKPFTTVKKIRNLEEDPNETE